MVESFSPDFYLPDMELYVELTTLKQKLVRKKNRKLRRLRELYPDIRIKLFYGRDFRMLMLKFGRMALLDDLTGTTGQSTPPRIEAAVAEAALVGPVATANALAVAAAVTGAQGAAADGAPAVAGDADTGIDVPAVARPGDEGEPAMTRDPAGGRSRRRGRRRRRASDAATSPRADPGAVPVLDQGPV